MSIAHDLIAHMRARMDANVRAIMLDTFTSTVPAPPQEDLTFEKIRQAMRDLNPPPRPPTIAFSIHATKDGDRTFPVSRHRSKRIHKKLIKRFGGEFKRDPAIYQVGDEIIAHPFFRSQLEAKTKETKSDVYMHTTQTNPILWGRRLYGTATI
ncbi:hypothetical protein [Bradyrhizobium sp. Tv2a-2]|uniref:hypothetical protein n=1 Tax=Bradyrhizobium sp. Tv2a-2 TaxID=113395 RepID=UPI000417F86D|nr:hypothetical protein [Bradyrhizobium sp. Tv2a-2]